MRAKMESSMESQSNIPDYSLPEERVPLFEPEHLGAEAKTALKAEIAQLLDDRGATLIAHYYVGRSCREIAQRSGLSLANVKVRLHRARRRLRRYLPPADEYREYTARRREATEGSLWPSEQAGRRRHARRCRISRQAR